MADGVSFLHSRDGKTESRGSRKVLKTESPKVWSPESKGNHPLYVPSPLERPGEVKSGRWKVRKFRVRRQKSNRPLYVPSPLERPGKVKSGRWKVRRQKPPSIQTPFAMADGVSFLHSRDGKTESRESLKVRKTERPKVWSLESKGNHPFYGPSPLERPGEVKSGRWKDRKSEDRRPESVDKSLLLYKPRLQMQKGFLFILPRWLIKYYIQTAAFPISSPLYNCSMQSWRKETAKNIASTPNSMVSATYNMLLYCMKMKNP